MIMKKKLMQYRNLKLLKKNYKHLFLPEIIIENNKYKLLATINYANFNHYNAIIFDNFNNKNNLILNENYIYDGEKGNNNFQMLDFNDIDDKMEQLLKYNPKIFIYY